MMGEVGVWEDIVWYWMLRWGRVRFDWESVQEEEMSRFISKGVLNREESDLQLWGGDTIGELSVKSAYMCLANQVNGLTDGLFKQLWQSKLIRLAFGFIFLLLHRFQFNPHYS